MKQELRSRERVIIIACDSGDLTAGSSLAPVLVEQQTQAQTHIFIYKDIDGGGCLSSHTTVLY